MEQQEHIDIEENQADVENVEQSEDIAVEAGEELSAEEIAESQDTISEDDANEQVAEKSILDEEPAEANIESVIEAILFASDEPLTKARLLNIAELSSASQITDAIKALNDKYRASNNSFRIERIAGGYQMMTLTIYNSWLKKMLKVKTDSKLSQAALETLAIVSYKQPVIRADVEGIRGVSSGEMIRSLMYKGLVKIVGRAEVIGRPLLYGTTKKFLEVFGLNNLKDLPKIEELKKPKDS